MLEDDALDILKEIKSISDNNLLKHYKFLIKPLHRLISKSN